MCAMGKDSNQCESDSLLKDDSTSQRRLQLSGYICGILTVVVFPISLGTSQALGDVVPFFQLSALRFAMVFVASGLISGTCKLNFASVFERKVVFFTIAYIILDLVQLSVLFETAKYISVTTSTCVKQTIEVLGSFLITYILTRVCKVSQAASACLCIIGVVFITQNQNSYSEVPCQTKSMELAPFVVGLLQKKSCSRTEMLLQSTVGISHGSTELSQCI